MNTDNKLRGKIFGGFNRQDVVNYIERSARLTSEYKASKEALEARCDELAEKLENEKFQNESLKADLEKAGEKTAELYSRINELENELNIMKQTISAKDEEIDALNRRISSCDEAIGAYESAKERIALLELNASRRAVNIEKDAESKAELLTRKCNELVSSLKSEYVAVCNDTEATVAHLTGEMDRLSVKLCEIAGLLSEKTERFDKLSGLITRGMED